MATPNLEKLSFRDLAELERKVAVAKQAAQDRARADLRDRIMGMVEEAGFKITDFFGSQRGGKGRKVAAKYANPGDPNETWTGRGRMPRWLHKATGGNRAKLEAYRIK